MKLLLLYSIFYFTNNLFIMSNYPPGAENDPNAPYNEPLIPDQEFEAEVLITLSKKVKVYSDEYNVQVFDEQPYYFISKEALENAVKDQITLPNEILKDWKLENLEIEEI